MGSGGFERSGGDDQQFVLCGLKAFLCIEQRKAVDNSDNFLPLKCRVGIHVMVENLIYKWYQNPLKRHAYGAPNYGSHKHGHLFKVVFTYTERS